VKRFIIALVVSILFVILLNIIMFKNTFTYETISNSVFIIGLIMFFYGLLAITNAFKLFNVVSYGLKSVIKRKTFRQKSYYDYLKEKEKEGQIPYTIELLVIGIVYVIISLVLAEFVIKSRNIDIIMYTILK